MMASSKPDFWQSVLNRRMLICVFTGFTSGLPFYVLVSMFQAWLRDGGVNLAELGFLTLVQLPYTWKFLWAPFTDSYTPAFLGRRRGWLIVTQVVLLLSIAGFGLLVPQDNIRLIAVVATLVAIASATQDIVIDAYRRELLPDAELGLGNSIHVQAWRISGLIPGSLALILADHIPWSAVFQLVALFMLPGILLTLFIKELPVQRPPANGFWASISEPFQEFVGRIGWRGAALVLAFLFLYKLGDSMATALSTAFYLDMGFSKTEIGVVAKNAGLWPSIIGGICGGLLMIRWGINRSLWIFGGVQWITIFGFVVMSQAGHNLWVMAAVIALEYLGVGLGTAAAVAFLARLTSPVFAATQFALLTAVAALPRTLSAAWAGVVVEQVGWTEFFYLCAALAAPGMLLLYWVAPWNGDKGLATGDREAAPD